MSERSRSIEEIGGTTITLLIGLAAIVALATSKDLQDTDKTTVWENGHRMTIEDDEPATWGDDWTINVVAMVAVNGCREPQDLEADKIPPAIAMWPDIARRANKITDIELTEVGFLVQRDQLLGQGISESYQGFIDELDCTYV